MIRIRHKTNPPHHAGWCISILGRDVVTYVPSLWRALCLAWKRRNLHR